MKNSQTDSWGKAHSDLLNTKKLVYDPCEFDCQILSISKESAAYGASTLLLNGRIVEFRVAKITPIKSGQFVTLWKRIEKSPIQPFDFSDSVDFFVISVRNIDCFGQFVFPKSVLYEQGIVSKNGQGGKNAIRVYPPWDVATNKQAQKTQKWQLKYFLAMPDNQPIDYVKARMLYMF